MDNHDVTGGQSPQVIYVTTPIGNYTLGERPIGKTSTGREITWPGPLSDWGRPVAAGVANFVWHDIWHVLRPLKTKRGRSKNKWIAIKPKDFIKLNERIV